MNLFSIALLAPLVCAEIGLVARSSNSELNNKEIRLVDGQLCIGDGPILQGYFDSNEKFVISPRLISANFSGAGVGLNHIQQLVVSLNGALDLNARAGWLEYQDSPVFYFEQSKTGWMLFASPGVESMKFVPSMLQIADIEYHGEHQAPRILAVDTEPLPVEQLIEEAEDYGYPPAHLEAMIDNSEQQQQHKPVTIDVEGAGAPVQAEAYAPPPVQAQPLPDQVPHQPQHGGFGNGPAPVPPQPQAPREKELQQQPSWQLQAEPSEPVVVPKPTKTRTVAMTVTAATPTVYEPVYVAATNNNVY